MSTLIYFQHFAQSSWYEEANLKYLFHKLPNNYLNPVTNPSLWFSDFKGCKNDLGNLWKSAAFHTSSQQPVNPVILIQYKSFILTNTMGNSEANDLWTHILKDSASKCFSNLPKFATLRQLWQNQHFAPSSFLHSNITKSRQATRRNLKALTS